LNAEAVWGGLREVIEEEQKINQRTQHESKRKKEGGRERVLVVYVKGGSADN